MPARPTVSFRFDDYSTPLVTHGKSSGAFYFETNRARSPLRAYSRIQIVRTLLIAAIAFIAECRFLSDGSMLSGTVVFFGTSSKR
ncbi:hypothetical protein PPTG_24756 [Phytophthora nicotianae INRA-310]|uniref:Uncharacterized protein n=1 Tax=Phytophthora nicotianae (strain INRA-310) TaxID=761204 RepID=W2PAE4_PHYN3|nr:hypothetical protein PPTG_24756 [Phytophthora nicotianae INRA-310]ETM98017.1 hypothetical protein PPTG_24756 [Phytophthora nicotianae INRA-310]